MVHARPSREKGDTARLSALHHERRTARFPHGRPAGIPYRPCPPPETDPLTQSPVVPRHPWELPLLVAAVAVTLTIVVFALHTLWTSLTDPQWPLLALLALPAGFWAVRGLLHAEQRAQSIKISPTQFPEAHRVIRTLSARMGLRSAPDAYVCHRGGRLSSAASGHGLRRYIVISSDLFEVGGRLRDPAALTFVVAHQLGHIAAGHTSFWRRLGTSVAAVVPVLGASLSRAMEYTADDHAHAYCPEGAHAVQLLAGGKYLYPRINLGEMADRARTERGPSLFLYNLFSHRPVNIKRMAAIRDRSSPGRVFL
ncbi:M48 family metallopeptidase [Allosalinactinospora lopnorensis]|uniref:M48 family metallopeptidase n=1 Tax=Allosalinactinospora lopnorensis TaxID=1352348 RepID=UPI0009E5F22F|nr:M48 family metallopeptidase [Allosalinactinospora lopnorensis]